MSSGGGFLTPQGYDQWQQQQQQAYQQQHHLAAQQQQGWGQPPQPMWPMHAPMSAAAPTFPPAGAPTMRMRHSPYDGSDHSIAPHRSSRGGASRSDSESDDRSISTTGGSASSVSSSASSMSDSAGDLDIRRGGRSSRAVIKKMEDAQRRADVAHERRLKDVSKHAESRSGGRANDLALAQMAKEFGMRFIPAGDRHSVGSWENLLYHTPSIRTGGRADRKTISKNKKVTLNEFRGIQERADLRTPKPRIDSMIPSNHPDKGDGIYLLSPQQAKLIQFGGGRKPSSSSVRSRSSSVDSRSSLGSDVDSSIGSRQGGDSEASISNVSASMSNMSDSARSRSSLGGAGSSCESSIGSLSTGSVSAGSLTGGSAMDEKQPRSGGKRHGNLSALNRNKKWARMLNKNKKHLRPGYGFDKSGRVVDSRGKLAKLFHALTPHSLAILKSKSGTFRSYLMDLKKNPSKAKKKSGKRGSKFASQLAAIRKGKSKSKSKKRSSKSKSKARKSSGKFRPKKSEVRKGFKVSKGVVTKVGKRGRASFKKALTDKGWKRYSAMKRGAPSKKKSSKKKTYKKKSSKKSSKKKSFKKSSHPRNKKGRFVKKRGGAVVESKSAGARKSTKTASRSATKKKTPKTTTTKASSSRSRAGGAARNANGTWVPDASDVRNGYRLTSNGRIKAANSNAFVSFEEGLRSAAFKQYTASKGVAASSSSSRRSTAALTGGARRKTTASKKKAPARSIKAKAKSSPSASRSGGKRNAKGQFMKKKKRTVKRKTTKRKASSKRKSSKRKSSTRSRAAKSRPRKANGQFA